MADQKDYDLFLSMDYVSDLSYGKLMEWINSDDSLSILDTARSSPVVLNYVLKRAVDTNADGWPAGILPALTLPVALPFAGSNPSIYNESTEAGVKIYSNFSTNGIWDMKVTLIDIYGRLKHHGAFVLQDDDGRMVRSDAYGNINYGYVMAMYGVPLDVSLRAANGNGDAVGKKDDELDDRAVEFGYQLYEKYPNGLTAKQYREEVANANPVP